MPNHCPECGAPVAEAGTCRDHFHALLLLEGEIDGVPGTMLHFYAVAAYGLQHPDSMNYTREALDGLRAVMAAALDGRTTPDDLRRRVRRGADGSQRVTRRPGDAAVTWRRGGWPVTIADVCTAETFGDCDTIGEYTDRLMNWARSIRETLDGDRVAGDSATGR